MLQALRESFEGDEPGLGAIIRVEEAMGLLEKGLPRHAG